MREITEKQRLLDEKGNIKNPGFAKKMLWEYDRKDIKAGKSRIKEWDYYLIVNDDMGVALTMDDNSYMGLMSLSLLDFKKSKSAFISSPIMVYCIPFFVQVYSVLVVVLPSVSVCV